MMRVLAEGARDVPPGGRRRRGLDQGAPGVPAPPAVRDAREDDAPRARARRANLVADELLAIYFLECRKPLLLEWLDLVGLAHEDGTLEGRHAGGAARGRARRRGREVPRSPATTPTASCCLRAFAAQNAIEWPALDALLGFNAG